MDVREAMEHAAVIDPAEHEENERLKAQVVPPKRRGRKAD
jgi:cysteine sulfinate desulfinase/cysteine desulfurase-like protein